jgi:hypothetical protein
MELIIVLLIILAFVIYFSPSFVLHEYLRKHNDKIPNILYINGHILRYLQQYRRATKIRHGRTGILYYMWYITTFFALGILVLVAVYLLI